MSLPLKVLVAPTLPAVAGRAVLASLPMSFVATQDPGEADIVIVDGQQPSWPDAVASAAGSRIVVVDPGAAGSPDRAARFLIDTPWGSNPVCGDVAEALRGTSWDRLECRSIVPRPTDLRLELLHLVCLCRSVGVPLDSLRLLLRTPAGLAAIGRTGTRVVQLDVIVTDAREPCARLRALTASGDVSVTLPSPQTASPAELVVTDERGALLRPTLWQNAHRATWVRVRQDAQADDAPGFGIDQRLTLAAFARQE